MRDYRDWQDAQREAQRQYIEYQRANQMYNAGNGVGYGYGRNRNMNRGYYRIYRNGSYYQIDSRGAEMLRQAVNRGYQQGYIEGRRDREYGRRYDYNDSSVYENSSYGYQSYVARDQYQYYFQQGFQRGYEDGYYSRTRYGYRQGTSMGILGNVLNTILNLSQN